MASFNFREHKTANGILLAVCDSELIDRTLKFGDVDFEVSSSFYGTEKAESGQILNLVERCHVANFVGKRIVGILCKRGLVSNEAVLMIDDIPHVQVLNM